MFDADLPSPGKAKTISGLRVQWWANGEWLFKGGDLLPALLLAREAGVECIDLSSAFRELKVDGSAMPEFLSSGVPMDVFAQAFGAGVGARTRFGHFDVALDVLEPNFCSLLFARSVANDAEQWIRRVANGLVAAYAEESRA